MMGRNETKQNKISKQQKVRNNSVILMVLFYFQKLVKQQKFHKTTKSP